MSNSKGENQTSSTRTAITLAKVVKYEILIQIQVWQVQTQLLVYITTHVSIIIMAHSGNNLQEKSSDNLFVELAKILSSLTPDIRAN